jgi:hypothetical protein
VAPFLSFIAIGGLPPQVLHPLRFVVVAALILFVSRRWLPLRPSFPWASAAVGAMVFVIWIAPDLLFGYRHGVLFENAITGRAASSIPESLRHNALLVAVRVANCAVLVPILEELFWRGWLMRVLIDSNFLSVRIGTYAPTAFFAVAILFASEHGPYWEVGLAAGILYNLWAMRTGNLADCILAHAVTNIALSAYVLFTGQWQYWL